MMLEITSSTIDDVCVMKNRVTSLKITSFEGEKFSTVISQLYTAISRLAFLDKSPHVTVPKLLEVSNHVLCRFTMTPFAFMIYSERLVRRLLLL